MANTEETTTIKLNKNIVQKLKELKKTNENYSLVILNLIEENKQLKKDKETLTKAIEKLTEK